MGLDGRLFVDLIVFVLLVYVEDVIRGLLVGSIISLSDYFGFFCSMVGLLIGIFGWELMVMGLLRGGFIVSFVLVNVDSYFSLVLKMGVGI